MKEGSRNGASLCQGFHEGDLEGGFLFWGILIYVNQGSEVGVCFRRGLAFGEHGWALPFGTFLLEEF